MQRWGSIPLAALLLAGCTPGTTVVLVPDDDGKVGQLTVASGGSSRTLDRSSAYVEVTDQISDIKHMDAAKMQDLFGVALAAAPPKPRSFLLYFRKDSTDLLADSKAMIPNIAKAIRSRPLAEVTLIGHSDHVGNNDYNERLSAARAQSVRTLLLEEDVDPEVLEVNSYGFRAPLIPAPAGVEEPRNRRVEVFLR